jgi:hypothetical protein
MAATYKSSVIARQLAEDLGLRLGLVVTTGVDGSGNPTIAVGAGTAGSQSAFIRVLQDYTPSLQVDGIGQVQRVYTPHVIQLVLETSTIANVALMTEVNKAKLMKEVMKFGTKVELYMSANTNAVDVADITSGNLQASIDDLWNPMIGTI